MTQDRCRIIFMGSPDFACPTLRRLATEHDVVHILTQPPRAKGRGMTEQKTAVAACGDTLGISASWPTSLKDEAIQAELASYQADLFVVVAYGLLLPQAVLDLPRLGCLNGHASLLPRWRGAAPIQRAIEAGDTQTGTCAMMMEKGLDTGPVIHCERTAITPQDTAQTLHDRLAEMTATCLSDAITALLDGRAQPQAQPEAGVCYAAKIQKSEAVLDFSQAADVLRAKIHAFTPFPGCFIEGASGKRLKCHQAVVSDIRHDASAGTLLSTADGLEIACGNQSVLRLTHIQPAGKSIMTADEFCRGRALTLGERIEAQL